MAFFFSSRLSATRDTNHLRLRTSLSILLRMTFFLKRRDNPCCDSPFRKTTEGNVNSFLFCVPIYWLFQFLYKKNLSQQRQILRSQSKNLFIFRPIIFWLLNLRSCPFFELMLTKYSSGPRYKSATAAGVILSYRFGLFTHILFFVRLLEMKLV